MTTSTRKNGRKIKQTAPKTGKKSAAYFRALEKRMVKVMIRICKADGIPIPPLPSKSKEKSK